MSFFFQADTVVNVIREVDIRLRQVNLLDSPASVLRLALAFAQLVRARLPLESLLVGDEFLLSLLMNPLRFFALFLFKFLLRFCSHLLSKVLLLGLDLVAEHLVFRAVLNISYGGYVLLDEASRVGSGLVYLAYRRTLMKEILGELS